MIGFRKDNVVPYEVCSNMLSHMDEAVVVIDGNHEIVFYNSSASRIFGYQVSEALGKNIVELMPPRAHSKNQMIEDFISGDVRASGVVNKKIQILGVRRDGNEFITSTTIINTSYGDKLFYSLVIRDITENKRNEEELLKLASTDPLTGVFNRREFRILAEKELIRTKRYGRPMSILMMDIDHFKTLNDTYGHAAGDKALQQFTKICSTSLRTMDVIARWGGEEFVVLLPETDIKGASSIAERLRKAVEGIEFNHNSNIIKFTVSVGAIEYKIGDDEIDIPLARVDAAMYKAKNTGRNRVCVVD